MPIEAATIMRDSLHIHHWKCSLVPHLLHRMGGVAHGAGHSSGILHSQTHGRDPVIIGDHLDNHHGVFYIQCQCFTCCIYRCMKIAIGYFS